MYCIYCGKKISNDSIFCTYCGLKQELFQENHLIKDCSLLYKTQDVSSLEHECTVKPSLETRDWFIIDSTYYRNIGETIQDMYTENGVQTVLSNMKIKKYNVEYYFRYLPVEDTDVLMMTKDIITPLDLGEPNIKFSPKTKNLIIISIPLKLNI